MPGGIYFAIRKGYCDISQMYVKEVFMDASCLVFCDWQSLKYLQLWVRVIFRD